MTITTLVRMLALAAIFSVAMSEGARSVHGNAAIISVAMAASAPVAGNDGCGIENFDCGDYTGSSDCLDSCEDYDCGEELELATGDPDCVRACGWDEDCYQPWDPCHPNWPAAWGYKVHCFYYPSDDL